VAITRAAAFRVAVEGEPVSVSCGRAAFLLVYPTGYLSIRLANDEVVTEPGDDLATIREALGGDAGDSRDEHGCSWRFTLVPWRDRSPTSWRVMKCFWSVESGAGPFSSWPTLAELRDQLRRDDGYLRAPEGEYHRLSLEWFEGEDPARFRFQPVFWHKPKVSWWRKRLWRLHDAAVADHLSSRRPRSEQ
jgi:hypothetical protein